MEWVNKKKEKTETHKYRQWTGGYQWGKGTGEVKNRID